MYTCSTIYGFRAFADDATKELAVDILNDIDWCLDQLEGMQTHRSVSDMTTNKVSRAAIGHGSNRLATKYEYDSTLSLAEIVSVKCL